MQTSPHRPPLLGQDEARSEAARSPHLMIPSSFIVQVAASHAGIGPYGKGGRDGFAAAATCYRAVDLSDRLRR